MKKLLLILLLLGAIVDQSQAKIQAGIGITAGANFGRWNNYFLHSKLSTAGGTLNFQPGAHAGIQARIWFNKFVGINVNVEFNMGGNQYKKYTGANYLSTFKDIHTENQLTIPLTAMVGWGNERLRIYANGGGYFGYIINGKDKTETVVNGGTPTKTSETSDYKSNYQNIDLGLRVGAGIQVYVDKSLKNSITFDINYDFGLYKVFRSGNPAYLNNADKLKLTPSKMMIGVGYVYNLGKSQAEEKPKRPEAAAE